jgi:hypothetical protein
MNIDKNKIDEATELIKLAINDYDSFLKKIDSFPSEKKAEAIFWLRNALRYVDKKKQNNNKK